MQVDRPSDATQHILKILAVHSADGEDAVDVSILLGGKCCKDPAVQLKLVHFLFGADLFKLLS